MVHFSAFTLAMALVAIISGANAKPAQHAADDSHVAATPGLSASTTSIAISQMGSAIPASVHPGIVSLSLSAQVAGDVVPSSSAASSSATTSMALSSSSTTAKMFTDTRYTTGKGDSTMTALEKSTGGAVGTLPVATGTGAAAVAIAATIDLLLG